VSTNRLFNLLVIVSLFFVGALVVQAAIVTRPLAQSTIGRQADVDRWVALGNYYSKQIVPNTGAGLERGREADAARWAAMGDYYHSINTSGAALQAQANLVSAARYTGLALQEYERTGAKNLLPTCLPLEVAAMFPAYQADHWKALVPACAQAP
jgi:hypothetical protein